LKTNGIKLGSHQNLSKTTIEKGTDTIRQNRQDNENWRQAITYIEHYQMKYGQVNYKEISLQQTKTGTKHGMVVRFVGGLLGDWREPFKIDIEIKLSFD
jgi:hypothetical protein